MKQSFKPAYRRLVLGVFAATGLFVGTDKVHAQAADADLVKKGEYVARLADCAACHTALHGKVYAGGLEIKTPVGAIYSTNITPDPTYGIGTYTLAEFGEAIRHGIRKDGSTLYPAMPYPAFARMSDDDVAALYAYFEHGVTPVAQANKAVQIPWPMSMRWPLAIWRMAFAPSPKPFTPAPGVDAETARGEYLVTGAGHCGACHTPRGFGMQEKALDASGGAVYLSGGAPIDNWVAPSLRNDPVMGLGRWSEDDIYTFLKSGRIDHSAVFGAMTDVVAWSTQYFTDSDLHAIAKYLKSLPPVPPARGDYTYDASTEQKLASANQGGDAGSVVYVQQCAICHRNDGGGVPRMFPPLAGNPVVVTDNPSSLINVVLHGGVLPATNYAPSSVAMPGYSHMLSDQQVADVVNMIRTSWGNRAPANVSAADVAKQRGSDTGSSASGWTASGSGWSIMHPQPYGYGWTFSPQTHAGHDEAQ
ncbi:alcohol dehydrogenase cytochrome c subunit [Ameyamaea chiangmaiensis NBRC 103196]|uniref:Cytochrome c n=1 Tax=Ameyamaea chiangmaiensis TaxID=442969 RepID=A0A850PCC4_9PROT|nr:cytochrome c [Ameyamaea chiangmaiensis]MBS4074343.1 cytochrome c [Ameyamaea chiangmaiensis]NVN40309.1 cytochrome c [Ameyamaea chiangmaiensis]GBQ71710.1 alcohol dehydrogenase cytochrome c subunit [Ameyamaea chiangmaiensis NBRC 103196]